MIEVSQIRNTQSIVFKPLGRIGVGVGYTYTTCGWCELQKSALTVKARKQLSEAKKVQNKITPMQHHTAL